MLISEHIYGKRYKEQKKTLIITHNLQPVTRNP